MRYEINISFFVGMAVGICIPAAVIFGWLGWDYLRTRRRQRRGFGN